MSMLGKPRSSGWWHCPQGLGVKGDFELGTTSQIYCRGETEETAVVHQKIILPNVTSLDELIGAMRWRLTQDDHVSAADREVFLRRLSSHAEQLENGLGAVYGQRSDFWDLVAASVLTAWDSYAQRPADLKVLDRDREAEPS